MGSILSSMGTAPRVGIRRGLLAAALWIGGVVLGQTAPPGSPVGSAAGPGPARGESVLVWNTLSQERTNPPSERFSNFIFTFTNVSPADVLIQSVQSSCFCTVAKLPARPWRIPPGSNGPIEVTMDVAGKSGRVLKGVVVETSAGRYNLTVSTTVTPPDPTALARNDAERLNNIQAALADRQAVFKRSECAACHAEPAQGKLEGSLLYAGVCANCHDSPHRASAVPDLRALPHSTDFEHWKRWITYGRAGSMMPAFTQAEGGPLTDQQIEAIAQYLARTVSRPTAAAATSPSPIVVPGGGSTAAVPKAEKNVPARAE